MRYEKLISDDPAFLISKVQPCPTSSGERGKRERGKKEEKDMTYSDPVETRIMTYPYTSCSSSRRFRLFKMTPQSRWSLQGRSGVSSLETRH